MKKLEGIKRRDFLKGGVAGAASVGLIGLTKKGFAQTPQFKFRLQSFLGPGWKEWEEMIPRYIKSIKEISSGRIEITAYPPGALVPTFELLDGVGRRVVEMGYGAQIYWKGIFPFTEWTWGIPFAFDVVDHYDYLWWEAGLLKLTREAFASIRRALRPGGTLVIPVGAPYSGQELRVVTKDLHGRVTERNALPVIFVPMTGASEG